MSDAVYLRDMSFKTFVIGTLLAACGSSGGSPVDSDAAVTPDAPTCGADLEAAIAAKLDAGLAKPDIAASQDVTVLLETSTGRRFTYRHGASTPSTVYESASTSKMVTAAILMDLVDQGKLTLDTKASDLLGFWTDDTVTLRHLMSFTSGYADEPLCLNGPNAGFEACVEKIFTSNEPTHTTPGTVFYYSGTHLQVAGLMAMKATGATSWSQIFDAWKARTNLFATAAYDLPSATNPRLAGGMHWTGEEYLGFLRALDHGTILSAASRSALFANQRGAATVGASPVFEQIHEDWAYGLGNWLECPSATQADSYNCGEGHRNSSAGAYGAYPFIDFDHDYFGMVAQQGELGTGFKGVLLVREAQSEIEAWAALDCD
jgi:CubicO group peptidase (beta-lactamase class C family)